MSSEKHLTYALDKITGQIVSVENVASGLHCNCICSACGGALMKKGGREFGKRKAHFAHYVLTQNCNAVKAYESMLHKLGKQILQEKKELFLPAYREYEDIEKILIPSKRQFFDSILIEQRIDDLIPDVVGIIDGKKIWIELANTHFVDSPNEKKLQKIRERNIECIEVNLRGQTLETLEDFLLNSDTNRYWIHSPSNKLLAEEELKKKKQHEEDQKRSDEEIKKQKLMQFENKIKQGKEEGCMKFTFEQKYRRPYNCPKVKAKRDQMCNGAYMKHPILRGILMGEKGTNPTIYQSRSGAQTGSYIYHNGQPYFIFDNPKEKNSPLLYRGLNEIQDMKDIGCNDCECNKLNSLSYHEIPRMDQNMSVCDYGLHGEDGYLKIHSSM